MKLREIAHSRTGDKGDYSAVSVIAFNPQDYEFLRERLTVEKVREKYREIVKGDIVRYELPKISAFIFDMQHALGGGVTRSLATDGHGKALCGIMLDIDL